MSSVYNNHWNSWNCNNTESELGHVVFATAIRRENGTNLWENPQGRQRQQWVQAFKAKFSKAEQVRQEMLAKVAATADDKKEKTADTKAAANARSVEPHYEQQYVTPNPYITSNPYVNKTPNPYLYQGITPEATPMHYYESPKAANYGNYSEVIDHGPDATSRIDVGSEVWVLDSKLGFGKKQQSWISKNTDIWSVSPDSTTTPALKFSFHTTGHRFVSKKYLLACKLKTPHLALTAQTTRA